MSDCYSGNLCLPEFFHLNILKLNSLEFAESIIVLLFGILLDVLSCIGQLKMELSTPSNVLCHRLCTLFYPRGAYPPHDTHGTNLLTQLRHNTPMSSSLLGQLENRLAQRNRRNPEEPMLGGYPRSRFLDLPQEKKENMRRMRELQELHFQRLRRNFHGLWSGTKQEFFVLFYFKQGENAGEQSNRGGLFLSICVWGFLIVRR